MTDYIEEDDGDYYGDEWESKYSQSKDVDPTRWWLWVVPLIVCLALLAADRAFELYTRPPQVVTRVSVVIFTNGMS